MLVVNWDESVIASSTKFVPSLLKAKEEIWRVIRLSDIYSAFFVYQGLPLILPTPCISYPAYTRVTVEIFWKV